MVRSISAQRAALLLLSLVLGLATSGCMSISAVQTARTLDPGQVQVQVGGGSLGVTTETRDTTTDAQGNTIKGALTTDTASIPEIELGARLGLTEGLDAGLKLVFPLSLMADVKYQFLDHSRVAGAVGLVAGYQTVTFNDDELKTLDLVVPLYFSVDLTEWLTAYASPKYFFRSMSSSTGESQITHMAGATGGIKLGRNFGLFIEGTRLAVLNDTSAGDGTTALSQFHVALFFNYGGSGRGAGPGMSAPSPSPGYGAPPPGYGAPAPADEPPPAQPQPVAPQPTPQRLR
ncbi:MAG: hypothetical protein H6747_01675 [Deltaproteobacteria bacterium]|nr:hypothetical protein [Deltaproteobacteria bacterium]